MQGCHRARGGEGDDDESESGTASFGLLIPLLSRGGDALAVDDEEAALGGARERGEAPKHEHGRGGRVDNEEGSSSSSLAGPLEHLVRLAGQRRVAEGHLRGGEKILSLFARTQNAKVTRSGWLRVLSGKRQNNER